MRMEVVPVAAARRRGPFDLYGAAAAALGAAGVRLRGGDVLAVSSKYVAVSEGRTVRLGGVRPSAAGRRMARAYGMDPALAEVVLREADEVVGGMPGLAMASSGGMLAPNAGVDRSSSGGGAAVLYPADPRAAAERLRRKLFLHMGVRAGVIVTDSRIMPARAGTVGVAVACAGIEPVSDERGRPDLDGAPLRVTVRATADGLASAANHGMGEGAESRPLAVIRGSGAAMTDRQIGPREAAVPPAGCLYARCLSGGRPMF